KGGGEDRRHAGRQQDDRKRPGKCGLRDHSSLMADPARCRWLIGPDGRLVPSGIGQSSFTTVALWNSWFSPMMTAHMGNPPSCVKTSRTSEASGGSSNARVASIDSPGPTRESSGTVADAGSEWNFRPRESTR